MSDKLLMFLKANPEALTAEQWASVLAALSPATQDGITEALLDADVKWGTFAEQRARGRAHCWSDDLTEIIRRVRELGSATLMEDSPEFDALEEMIAENARLRGERDEARAGRDSLDERYTFKCAKCGGSFYGEVPIDACPECEASGGSVQHAGSSVSGRTPEPPESSSPLDACDLLLAFEALCASFARAVFGPPMEDVPPTPDRTAHPFDDCVVCEATSMGTSPAPETGSTPESAGSYHQLLCRGCSQPLSFDYEQQRVADGCPCNSRRGINHGLVPTHVCTCDECDPEQTGAVRSRPPYGHISKADECQVDSPRSEPWERGPRPDYATRRELEELREAIVEAVEAVVADRRRWFERHGGIPPEVSDPWPDLETLATALRSRLEKLEAGK